MAEKFDLVVIGAGPGGYVAAIRAAQLGMKVACVEKRETLGGTCLNVGCIPSKALLQSSELFHKLDKEGHEHGISAGEVKPNLEQMMKRKTDIVSSLTTGIAGLFKKNKVEWIPGTASFVSKNLLEVEKNGDKRMVEAPTILLASGSEPIELPFLKFDEKMVVSSTGALSLEKIPEKMAVIGGGVIGLELASVYARLGSEVVVIEMLDHLCPTMDAAISKSMLQVFKKQGISFHLGKKVMKANVQDDKVSLVVGDENENFIVDADVCLVSIGRKPYTQGLNLDKAGITLNDKGQIPVDGYFRTDTPNIYAIGDIIDGPMLAHKASDEGIAAIEIIAGNKPHINYMAIPNVVYTWPEVAGVGLSEQECKEAGMKVNVGTAFFKGSSRARCMGDTDGFVKVIGCTETDRLVGMHIIGPGASELITEGVVAIEKRATVTEIADACHAHPTLTESIKEAAMNAHGRAIHM